jgi:hypothetical protein
MQNLVEFVHLKIILVIHEKWIQKCDELKK